MKSKEYWRGYMAAIEDAAQVICDKIAHAHYFQCMIFMLLVKNNVPEEIEGKPGCIERISCMPSKAVNGVKTQS